MSYDIFLQGFRDGDAAEAGGSEAVAVLAPYLTQPYGDPPTIQTEDGCADVYGLATESLMFTHVEGRAAFDLMYEVAKAATWVVMPVGAPVCVPDRSVIEHLPAELRENVVIISSGADLRACIRESS